MNFSRMLIVAPVAFFLVGLSIPVAAHGGGLDRCGGHNDRKSGGYHVHNQAEYCACHPASPGCASPKPAVPAPQPAVPGQAQGIAAVSDADALTTIVYVTASGTKYHRRPPLPDLDRPCDDDCQGCGDERPEHSSTLACCASCTT